VRRFFHWFRATDDKSWRETFKVTLTEQIWKQRGDDDIGFQNENST